MEPVFFKTPDDFRSWLTKNHEVESELMVGFYKKDSGKKSITWPESVAVALCFGWIDGIRRSFGNDAYTIRFTPRKDNSTWSAVNIAKVEELINNGMMMPAGLAAFKKRNEHNSKIYAHEQKEPAVLPAVFLKQFKADKNAWLFFEAQPPYYRKIMTHWVTSAKQEKTRQQRLLKLIEASAGHKRLT